MARKSKKNKSEKGIPKKVTSKAVDLFVAMGEEDSILQAISDGTYTYTKEDFHMEYPGAKYMVQVSITPVLGWDLKGEEMLEKTWPPVIE